MQGFIIFEEIISYGVSDGYVKVAMNRFRMGMSKSWAHVRDDYDKRKVWIHLDSIPAPTRQKHNIPTSEEYEAQKLIAQQKKEALKKQQQEDKKLKSLIKAYENQWIKYSPLYNDRLNDVESPNSDFIIKCATEHAFWLQMIKVSGNQYKADYGIIPSCFEKYLTLKKRGMKTLCNVTTQNAFRLKLGAIREANLKGVKYLMDEIIGQRKKRKPRNVRVTDFHNALMLAYLSHGQKYSYRVVTDLVNHHCQLNGYKTISESSIKTKMNSDIKFRTLVEEQRHGNKFASDTILPYAVRNVTPYPANVWMIDGTPLQFYCWNESRTRKVRLNLFVIIDVCSRKIVGMDVSYSEDRFNILNALKMAVYNEGYLPAEIVSDNFSANKSEEILDLKIQLERLGVLWRNSKVGNAQDKSYVERFFGTFQTVECALHDGYMGEGITSKRNNRPNPEHISKVNKEKGYSSFNEMKSQVATMIAKYNERSISGRKSPNTVCKSLPKPNAIELDIFNSSLLFWKKKSCTVRRGKVQIVVQKIPYIYEVHDHDVKLKLNKQKVTVRYDENDLESIMLFDFEKDHPICECKQELKVSMAAVDRDKDDLSIQKHSAKVKSYKTHIQKEQQSIIDKGLNQVGVDELDLVHPLLLSKNQLKSAESKSFLNRFHEDHNIQPEEEFKVDPKPIGTIKHSKYEDITEQLFERPIKKATKVASFKPVSSNTEH